MLAVLFAFAPALSPLAADSPPPPRIDQVVPLAKQPRTREAVIWRDDFDDDAMQDRYGEKSGETTDTVRIGDSGKSLEMRYAKGSRGTGGRKVFFGDTPTYRQKAARPDETFTDVYWRIYVKHQRGWQGGGPAKLSRATSLVPPGWRQAMIAHVWSSGDRLTLDPASGVRGGEVVTRKYNDFPQLRWLGNRPASRLAIHSAEESGWWVCVEARAKLNTPGEKDGVNQLWIDGRLEAERRGLDWRGTFDERGINAVFLEAYWNEGSPVEQRRWIEHLEISTAPIGPLVCPRQPIVVLASLTSDETAASPVVAWELELATVDEEPDLERGEESSSLDDREAGTTVVWRSRTLGPERRVQVDAKSGEFTGALVGESRLASKTVHRGRVRQRVGDGAWSAWSRWHQTFLTEE